MTRAMLLSAAVAGIFCLIGPAKADEPAGGAGKGKHLERLFKKLDTNNDGKLSKEEFLKLADLRKNRPGAQPAAAKPKAGQHLSKIFDKLDTNNDGFLSFEEFSKLPELRKHKKPAQPEPGN